MAAGGASRTSHRRESELCLDHSRKFWTLRALPTRAIEDLQRIRGVDVPADVKFRQIIVTGPPASGKSSLVRSLGGWPEEGYLDLAGQWWRQRLLTFRPREVHFGFPVVGWKHSLAVFDREWLESPVDTDWHRVRIPPTKRGLFRIDWRNRYVFDFQLPPPDEIFIICKARARAGTHPRDRHVTREQIELQVDAYAALALHFHRHHLRVYVRQSFQGTPRRIVERDVPVSAAIGE